MPQPKPIKGTCWEDGGCSLMARVVGPTSAAITQAAVSSITCAVFDLDGDSPSSAVATPSIVVASTVFDTLQTDGRWSVDSTGYNFRYDAAASIFATGGHRYRFEFRFTPASGQVYWVVFEVTAESLLTS